MMNAYWVQTFPARWFKTAAVLLCIASLATAATAASGALANLVKTYRENPTPRGKAALLAYARAHSSDPNGALAHLALGVVAYQQKDNAAAAAYFNQARPGLPKLADYVDYYQAAAAAQATDLAAVQRDLRDLKEFSAPLSPVAAKAALLAAKAATGSDAKEKTAAAIQLVRDNYEHLPQPDADFALASAYEAQGDPAQAAAFYQRVYFSHPATHEAAEASTALEHLRVTLGAAYPPAMPPQMLERGDRWLAAHEYVKARQEFEALVPQLGGVEREQAQVRAGAARYLGGDAGGAYSYLKELKFPHDEGDAERLYYLEECSRHMGANDHMEEAVKQLNRHHQDSPWRLKALIAAGNRYLVENQPSHYEPFYRAGYESFAPDAGTAYCHWKITWDAYMARKKEAAELLREQIAKYPFDPRAATALYFLGRLEEEQSNFTVARACYNKIDANFPHYYYAVLARERLTHNAMAGAVPDPKTTTWLASLEFPSHERLAIEEPTAATRARIERARLLIAAGFPDWAETEVRFGTKVDGQAHLLAMETAKLSPSTFASLRRMKSLSGDYLALPYESAPKKFWQLLFPLPWQKDLMESSRRASLDPFLVAALIRQESEFNAAALSHANAYGLTQIVPSTGRALARQQGMRRFRTDQLFDPAVNLRLGSVYIRSLLDQWNGKWEETLASYNAGKSRVIDWKTWNNYREPAEFVESIPFTETREYVQAVLRNASLYREIYAENIPAADRVEPAPRIVHVKAKPRTRVKGVRIQKASHVKRGVARKRHRKPAA